MLYPFTFDPIFKERIWGGQNLKRLYGKDLPPNVPIGESWEIVDRPEAVSLINNGPYKGKSLRWLVENHGAELLGSSSALNGRFPLLIKILDAEEKLSLQVHPPAVIASNMGGEPKTEMWYVTEARQGAELFVGLKQGTTRSQFEAQIRDGSVSNCFHRLSVEQGDSMFLPSGRVHAIGGSVVIFEVQQNSDTTYRVFDWNRVDVNGKPRELHIDQSLRCIDFDDFEPELVKANHALSQQILVDDDLFQVATRKGNDRQEIDLRGSFAIIGGISGEIRINSSEPSVRLGAGEFCLVPSTVGSVDLEKTSDSEFLWITAGDEQARRTKP
ncbi:MAG: Mannose-6-phosphate isomerase [Verrucomicrobiales bacterium]|jgi:mannose-6-phosphate isomerase|nr:Mannose-6-phosphate isomerase [Verrucomicrobiales bacterium]